MEFIINTIWSWIISHILDHIFSTGRKTEEIIITYERRLVDKEKSIEKLTREQKKAEKERLRVIDSLKRSGLSTEKLVERYDKPLNAILISYSHQNPKGFIKDEIGRYNSKWLGGEVSIIPPTNVPKNIKNKDDLKIWFEDEILKGRECKLKFLTLIDIRAKSYWYTYLPNADIERIHSTIGEKLSIEDIFTTEQIKTIALKDIIQAGDIAWLSSRVLSLDELKTIHLNQTTIERKLGNPSLRELANDEMLSKLLSVLAEFGIASPEEVSEAIIDEAKFWNKKIK